MGQTTSDTRKRNSQAATPAASDWKTLKAEREKRNGKRSEQSQVGTLPLTNPGQALTPAPKPIPRTKPVSSQRIPANKPLARDSKQSTAEVLKPKTSKIGSQSANRGQSKPKTAAPKKSA